MKRYNRKRATAWQTSQRFASGQPQEPNRVPLANFEPLIQKQSLLRLQIGLAGLIRNRQRIEMRMSKAIAGNKLDKAKVLAKLHVRTTETAQAIADEIAKRTFVAETRDKPKPSRKRTARATANHSRVRRINPATLAEPVQPEATPAEPVQPSEPQAEPKPVRKPRKPATRKPRKSRAKA
jgi:hypothetical protein